MILTTGVCRSTHVRAVVLRSDIQYGDVSFTNKGPRAGKNPVRLFPYDPTWFRISCYVTHYGNVPTLHSFNYVGNNFHQRRSQNTKMILRYENNVNSLVKAPIMATARFISELIKNAISRQKWLNSLQLPIDSFKDYPHQQVWRKHEVASGPSWEFTFYPIKESHVLQVPQLPPSLSLLIDLS